MESDFVGPAQPSYPAIQFLLRHGGLIAIAAGILPLLVGLWLMASGISVGFGLACVLAAPFVYLLMRSYVELVAIIADMLLPK